MPTEKLMTVQEAAERLGKTQAFLFKALERGYLPATRRNGGLLISSLDLEAYRQRIFASRLTPHVTRQKTHKRPGRSPK